MSDTTDDIESSSILCRECKEQIEDCVCGTIREKKGGY